MIITGSESMTDAETPVQQQSYWPSDRPRCVASPVPTSELLTSVRLRLLQAEEQLLRGEWRKAQQYLLTARNLLDRSEVPPASPQLRGGLTLRQKQRLQLYIEQYLGRSIALSELAQQLGLSYSHFCRVFRQSFGHTPLAYMRTRRVERAKELMMSGRLPLSLVAQECGLSDQAALSKLFRRATGHTPAAWRRGQRA
jgi:AraC family transcriptional regulator